MAPSMLPIRFFRSETRGGRSQALAGHRELLLKRSPLSASATSSASRSRGADAVASSLNASWRAAFFLYIFAMPSLKRFASGRAQIESHLAITHALRMRRNSDRRARVLGLWRGLESLVERNRIISGRALLLIVMIAAVLGLTWHFQDTQKGLLAPAPASASEPNLAAASEMLSVPQVQHKTASATVNHRAKVGVVTAESDGISPVLRMDYQLNPTSTISSAPSPEATITLPTIALPSEPILSRQPISLRQPAKVEVSVQVTPTPTLAPTYPTSPVPRGRSGFVSFEADRVGSKPADQLVAHSAQVASSTNPAVAPESASPFTSPPTQAAPIAVFTIVGAPTDEVILIQNKGEEVVRPVRLGETLPNGEVVLLINPGEGRVKTDRRSVQLESR